MNKIIRFFSKIFSQDISNGSITYPNKILLEDIVYNLPGLVYWKNCKYQYVGFNKNVVTLSGLSREQLKGKTDFELNWGKKEALYFQSDDQEVMTTGKPKITEHVIPIKRPDGHFMVVRTEKTRLCNERGVVIGVLGVGIDITEEKLIESREKETLAELFTVANVKAQAEERLRQAVMILAGSIAHDLRTPISILEMNGCALNNSQFMLKNGETIPLPLREKLSLMGDNIIQTTQQMHNFIDVTLKTISKVTSGNLPEEDLVLCSMWHCIHNTLQRYPFTNGQHKLITWDQRDFKFKGNELLMIRILFNLIKNSLEQIDKNNIGEISINTEMKDNVNIIHFKDTAGGVSPEVMENLFPGYATTKEKGSGVGLAFCKIVMENFGGTISCHSVYGKYITFTLTFPIIKCLSQS